MTRRFCRVNIREAFSGQLFSLFWPLRPRAYLSAFFGFGNLLFISNREYGRETGKSIQLMSKKQKPLRPVDVFFELPLDKWDLFDSKTLARSKIVLLHDLKPVVDMFNDDGVGVGARTAAEVISEVGLNTHDRQRLISLLGARSFDVYSVRAALNDFISDEELDQIQIPPKEQERLQNYMNNYSRGLLKVILEGTEVKVTGRSSLSSILDGANRGTVLKNLIDISDRLRIEPTDIVVYISKLSEIILAISYYQRVYDGLQEDLKELLVEIRKLNAQDTLNIRYPGIKEETHEAMIAGRNSIVTLNGYFHQFEKVEKFFDDITPEKFRSLRQNVEIHYRAIGMIVCFWQIKIDDWRKRFWDDRGRRKDSTWEQRYNFFKDTVYHNLYTIEENLDLIKNARLEFAADDDAASSNAEKTGDDTAKAPAAQEPGENAESEASTPVEDDTA